MNYSPIPKPVEMFVIGLVCSIVGFAVLITIWLEV